MPDPPDDPLVHEETDNPLYAEGRMFYKVEKWTSDGRWSIACSTPAIASVGLARSSKRRSSTDRESN
jgi:hypothetical protein